MVKQLIIINCKKFIFTYMYLYRGLVTYHAYLRIEHAKKCWFLPTNMHTFLTLKEYCIVTLSIIEK